ncbi:MAG: hypothetical protein J1F05_00300 [Muribaculaceae bacterium]|nr:hypothetical protein [Muribaculaceae bacterium]
MKKLLLAAALAAFGFLANAQVVIPVYQGDGALKCANEKIVLNKQISKFNAPKKVASLDDAMVWGYYLGDLSDENIGASGVQAPATYYVGYYVPGSGVLKGASIVGINLPVFTAENMTDVSVWISEDLETDVVSKEVNEKTLIDFEFNAVALDEPYKIPADGVYVGAKFTINAVYSEGDAYPILMESVDEPAEYSMLLRFVASGQDSGWDDYTDYFSAQYAMQLFCTDMALNEREASFRSVMSSSVLPGGEATVPAVIASDGSEDINSIDYIVEINGVKTTYHLDLKTPIAKGFNKKGEVDLTYTAPEEYGAYTALFSIDKVNGKDNAASDEKLLVVNKVLTKIVERYTVVEEFTGTGCGWCPRGWFGMEALKEQRENFIGIAFHQYNSSDPMYNSAYFPAYQLGISGAPGCTVDRKYLGVDPYYGNTSGTPLGIIDLFDFCNALLPDVDITLTADFNDDMSEVNVAADVEYLTNGDKYSIAYVLTADNITGTTAIWKQANYFADYPPSKFNNDPNLSQFCRGGSMASSSLTLVYNDVMIGSSYGTSGVNRAPALDGEVKAGNIVSNSYTVAMPTKAVLKKALDYDNIYAIALVVSSDGAIANAARVKVGGDQNGVENVVTDANAVEVARFNIAGQVISAPQKGINIVKYSNGKTEKVIVR